VFEREHHRRIQKLLSAFDADFLSRTQCYFGGGTAIVLALNEYRESVDVDFLCASVDGYRELRNAVNQHSLGALLKMPVEYFREIKTDQYGIRTVLKVDDTPIKFEIVREGRIQLQGQRDPSLGIDVLTPGDMFAEKLLANADRGLDKSVMSRDIIDIAMMLQFWEGVPPGGAWDKVRHAYGDSVDRAYQKAIDMVTNDRKYLAACIEKMKMDPGLVDLIPDTLSNHPAPPSKRHQPTAESAAPRP
jgi:hypothetical protein